MTSKTSCPSYILLGNLFLGGLVFCWYFKKIYFAKTLVLRIVCRTRAGGTHGPTVKNLTLTFWPKIFSWPVHMYRKSPTKFERKFQCKIFHDDDDDVSPLQPKASYFWIIFYIWASTFNSIESLSSTEVNTTKHKQRKLQLQRRKVKVINLVATIQSCLLHIRTTTRSQRLLANRKPSRQSSHKCLN